MVKQYLHPTLRRWVSRDPIGILSRSANPMQDAEMLEPPNLYEYAKNQPINLTDPYGLCCINGKPGVEKLWYEVNFGGNLEKCRAEMAASFGGLVAGTAGAAVTGADPWGGLAAAAMYGVIKCKQVICVPIPAPAFRF